MSDPNPHKTLLDQNEIMQNVYDTVTQRLRVDSEVTAVVTVAEVTVDHTTSNILVYGNDGTTDRKIKTDASGDLQVGVISSVLPTGASTEATLSTLNGKVPNGLSVTGARLLVDGSGVIQPVSGTVTANIGTAGGLALDSSVTGLQVSQGSTTSGQKGDLILGAVTTSAPSYTTGQTTPLSLTTGGLLRVDGSGTTQTVTGTIAATQSGAWTTGRTWDLASGTDSVSAVQNGTWNLDNISGTISLPTGAATSANQTPANTSLASIDTKLTSPLSTTETQKSNSWQSVGDVATSSTTTALLMRTSFTYETANATPTVQSSSANDTLAGTGAQKITITYFKADGSGPFTSTENMQGTTIFFSAASAAFIESVVVSQVGSGGTNAGTILLSDLSPLSTMASINPGDNETYYCHHFVPLGKTAYITQFSYSSTATAVGQGGQFVLKKQNIPLASNAKLTTIGVQSLVGTTSTENITFPTPIKVVGPALLFGQVTPDSATANTFTAAFGGYEI